MTDNIDPLFAAEVDGMRKAAAEEAERTAVLDSQKAIRGDD